MGGIMSYSRFRTRNGMKRTVPLGADPYTQERDLTEKKWDEENAGSSAEPPEYVRRLRDRRTTAGELNRFENDILGLSCWCNRHTCCEHPSSDHVERPNPVVPDAFSTYVLAECTRCPCEKWDWRPLHRDGAVCPDNRYASQIAAAAGTDQETVRAVVRALMDTP